MKDKIKISRTFEVDQHDINCIHDIIIDWIDVDCSTEEIVKLILLSSDYTGGCGTHVIDSLIDDITLHFTRMKFPRYGDSEDYKERFNAVTLASKNNFIDYLKK